MTTTDADNPAIVEPAYYEIFTERLKLRTLRVSDAEALMPIISSKEVMQWTTEAPVQDIPHAERWVKHRALGQDVFNFIIELRCPDEHTDDVPVVGVAGTFHVPKVGYLIHPSYWGKGIASEALRAIVSAIFERFPCSSESVHGLDYVEGWIDVKNAASRRVLEKCGFTWCEEMDAPPDAPGYVSRVAVLRRAREGMDLDDMGLGKGQTGDRPAPPLE